MYVLDGSDLKKNNFLSIVRASGMWPEPAALAGWIQPAAAAACRLPIRRREAPALAAARNSCRRHQPRGINRRRLPRYRGTQNGGRAAAANTSPSWRLGPAAAAAAAAVLSQQQRFAVGQFRVRGLADTSALAEATAANRFPVPTVRKKQNKARKINFVINTYMVCAVI
jgi:hypothetical protein